LQIGRFSAKTSSVIHNLAVDLVTCNIYQRHMPYQS